VFTYGVQVEQHLLKILKGRVEDCAFYEKGTGMAAWGDPRDGVLISLKEGSQHVCKGIQDTYDRCEFFHLKECFVTSGFGSALVLIRIQIQGFDNQKVKKKL
jgi:hypothetical protein